jgi:hypothetical protein
MQERQPAAETDSEKQEWKSNLSRGRERFLAHVMDHGHQTGRRTADDFLRHFPPMEVMKALREQPELRAAIMTHTVGTKRRVALKKSWESAGEDVQIALEEKETDAAAVLEMLDLDDRVRYFDAKQLWSFVTEGDFWNVATGSLELETARAHIAFMLERALEDKLLTHQNIVDGITVDELASRLPKSQLGNIIKQSLANSQAGTPFTERDLLGAVPPDVLVQYVPLPHLWEAVIVPKIAARHGYIDRKTASADAANDAAQGQAATAEPAGAVSDGGEPGAANDHDPSQAEADSEGDSGTAGTADLPEVASASAGRVESADPNPAAQLAQHRRMRRIERGQLGGAKGPGIAKKREDSTIDPMTWSAEVADDDLLEEEEDLMIEVINS